MKKEITIGLAMAMTATMALGGRLETTGDGIWTNTAVVWSSGAPGSGDIARISNVVTLDTAQSVDKLAVGYDAGAGDLTIISGGALMAGRSADVGDSSAGTLLVDGGQMGVNGALNVGNGSTGSLTVDNGGYLYMSANLSVGKSTLGTLTLNDGHIQGRNLNVGNTVGFGLGTVNLLGGTMSLTNSAASDDGRLDIRTAGDVLNIENDAQLIIGGDQWTNIASFVTADNIDWDNGSGMAGVGDKTWVNGSGSYLHSEFDGTVTTVWVNQTIPEPATLGLVAMAGVGLLVLRRRASKL